MNSMGQRDAMDHLKRQCNIHNALGAAYRAAERDLALDKTNVSKIEACAAAKTAVAAACYAANAAYDAVYPRRCDYPSAYGGNWDNEYEALLDD